MVEIKYPARTNHDTPKREAAATEGITDRQEFVAAFRRRFTAGEDHQADRLIDHRFKIGAYG